MKWCKVDNNSVSLKDKSLILGHRHCTSLPLQVEDEDYASDSRNAPIALTAGRKNAPRYQNFMVADSSNIPAFNLLCQRISVDFPHVFLYLCLKFLVSCYFFCQFTMLVITYKTWSNCRSS